MASVHYRTGIETISAKSTEVFTFWWPSAYAYIQEAPVFFDVSIGPDFDGEHAVITPLLEVKREKTFFFEVENDPPSFNNTMLRLTLHNDNDFPVRFSTAYVLIVR